MNLEGHYKEEWLIKSIKKEKKRERVKFRKVFKMVNRTVLPGRNIRFAVPYPEVISYTNVLCTLAVEYFYVVLEKYFTTWRETKQPKSPSLAVYPEGSWKVNELKM